MSFEDDRPTPREELVSQYRAIVLVLIIIASAVLGFILGLGVGML